MNSIIRCTEGEAKEMIKVILTYDYGKENIAAIEALGYEVTLINENAHGSQSEGTLGLGDKATEVLICYNPFDRLKLSDYPQLKWIQLSSIGIDQLPKEEVLERGISVTNNQGGYSIPMGEWIVYKMLEAYKMGRTLQKQQAHKKWKMQSGVRELTHKKAMFLGTGTIAKEAAKRLEPFNIERIGINTTGHPAEGFDKVFFIEALEKEVAQADFLIVSVPHTPATEKLVSQKVLGAMKEDAVLINIARGAIIDEDALIQYLEEGKFLSVALDVTVTEPLPAESPLWTFEQVDITPHNSWISEYRNQRRFDLILDNLEAYANQKPLKNVVDVKRGY